MNLANKLTVSRFAMVPVFVVLLEFGNMGLSLGWQLGGRAGALLVFIAAIITDYYDGVLARRHGTITNFGRFMDPLADKLIVAAAFIVLVEDGMAPAWMVVAILCREFLVTGLRLLGASRRRVIQADRWGKNKTISQMAAIVTALVFLMARDALQLMGCWTAIRIAGRGLDFWLPTVFYVWMCLVVFLTLASGGIYLWRNRDLLSEDEPQDSGDEGKIGRP